MVKLSILYLKGWKVFCLSEEDLTFEGFTNIPEISWYISFNSSIAEDSFIAYITLSI